MKTESLRETARVGAGAGTGPSKTAQVMVVLLQHAVDYEHALSGKQIHRLTQMEPNDVHRVLSRLSAPGENKQRSGVSRLVALLA